MPATPQASVIPCNVWCTLASITDNLDNVTLGAYTNDTASKQCANTIVGLVPDRSQAQIYLTGHHPGLLITQTGGMGMRGPE